MGEEKKWICPICRTENSMQEKFCRQCGMIQDVNAEIIGGGDEPQDAASETGRVNLRKKKAQAGGKKAKKKQAEVPQEASAAETAVPETDRLETAQGTETEIQPGADPAAAAPLPETNAAEGEAPVPVVGDTEEPNTGQKVCPVCGAVNKPDVKFCRRCGTKMAPEAAAQKEKKAEPAAAVCPACGMKAEPGAKFCKACGHSLQVTSALQSAPEHSKETAQEVTSALQSAPEHSEETAQEVTSALQSAPERSKETAQKETTEEKKQDNSDRNVCPVCGAVNLPGTVFCVKCGMNLKEIEKKKPEYQDTGGKAVVNSDTGERAKKLKRIVILIVLACAIAVVVVLVLKKDDLKSSSASSDTQTEEIEESAESADETEENEETEEEETVTEEETEEIEETEETAEDGEEDTEEESEYILADSDSRYLTREEVEALTDEELYLARNELYARHGRRFKTEALQEYFDSLSWYNGIYDPDEFDALGDTVFNEYEIYNRDLIVEVESERQ